MTQLPFHYQDGQLMCEATALADIATAVGTPVYVYSKAELVRRARAYREAAPASHLVCYAVKANGNLALLRLLRDAGLGADVTSGGELYLALEAGIPPEAIIYSGVGKTAAEIETALQKGIRALHVESPAELARIAAIAERLQRTAAVGVRVNPDIYAETHPYISTGQQAHKFGVPPEQAMAMLREAAAHPWLRPVGLAGHIGSQIRDLAPFVQLAEFLVNLAAQLAAENIQLTYLDVGGGWGIDYSDYANNPVERLTMWAEAVGEPVAAAGYELVMEPGRSIVGPTGVLLTEVVYTKQQGDKQFIIGDAGMNDLIRPTLYQAHHPLLPVRQPADAAVPLIADLVGPVCETGDYLARERPIPPVTSGDLLAVMMTGAYGFAMSSNYNGRPRPAEVLVDDDQFRIIRKRQTYEALVDGCEGE